MAPTTNALVQQVHREWRKKLQAPAFDVIVLGAGGVGSAVLAELARRGFRVLGIDQLPTGHDRGSSHGETRVIRVAYFEHPDYVPLAQAALARWHKLEQQTGQSLVRPLGLLQGGPDDGSVIRGLARRPDSMAWRLRKMRADECPQCFCLPPQASGHALLLEAGAGYLHVERCVAALTERALRQGAQLITDQRIVDWQSDGGSCRVQTSTAWYTSRHVVLALGSGQRDLGRLPGTRLHVLRKHLYWYAFQPQPAWADTFRNLPVFLFETARGVFYGFPSLDGATVKVARHSGGSLVAGDPFAAPRPADPDDHALVEAFLRDYLSGAGIGFVLQSQTKRRRRHRPWRRRMGSLGKHVFPGGLCAPRPAKVPYACILIARICRRPIMPAKPRSETFDPDVVGVYHCWNRLVQRRHLFGLDVLTGKDHSHRKEWLRDRLKVLAGIMALDVLDYAVLDNHLHLVLRNRPDIVGIWDDSQVAARWWSLCPERKNEDGSAAEPTAAELRYFEQEADEYRRRLSDISWFMRLLCQPIARRANQEDGVDGRFFAKRFDCERLKSEADLLACSLYVDLNVIHAGIAETPEESSYTSAFDRIRARWRTAQQELSGKSCDLSSEEGQPDDWLAPIFLDERAEAYRDVEPAAAANPIGAPRVSNLGFLPITCAQYLTLLDRMGRLFRQGKRGQIPGDLPPILQRLNLGAEHLIDAIAEFFAGPSSYRAPPELAAGSATTPRL